MRIGTVIVTYNPDNNVLQLIQECISQATQVLVVDNGSNQNDPTILAINDLLQDHKELKYTSLEKNFGLAFAQNVGIKEFEDLHFDRVVFFDQDSQIPKDFFESMSRTFDTLLDEGEPVGILAPNYLDKNILEYAHFAKLTPNGYQDITLKSDETAEVSFVISSGSMMPVAIFKEIGDFNQEFFIDQVDTEFCLRVLSHGYKIFATAACTLAHTIGNRTKKRLLFLTIKPNHHSSKRKFYITRNGVKTMLLYKEEFPGFRKLMTYRLIHDAMAVVFFEKDKLKKLGAMYQGIRQAYKPYEEWD
ncbi:glycosyltransferase family 2 protein [Granulicatella seriolae]|uniref:Glycosyltransferase family 2 protein n=1 Tax=Granulicatella seriolae TaxID=2967226 RepID=A0ABT1WN75_9LACT|nr:glycosyltransferase family 2 protein [Granulicatella seriolae]